MNLSKIEQNETVRLTLIESQKGDGCYNPITGVYKWDNLVYDLTKTNGEIGLGWMSIRTKIIKNGKI